MAENSKIEWCDATWNPVRGCTKISPGCKNCYAQRFAERWRNVPGHAYEQGFDLRLVPEKLDEPLDWKKPRRIFVCSMGDLYHKKVPWPFMQRVFETMARARRHTFQILTKRPKRMSDIATYWGWPDNVWAGVSVEDQQRADERTPHLMQTAVAVRFLSIEPLLGPVVLRDEWLEGIHWVIVGGESGPGAREMQADWVRSIRDQCSKANVPFFFKQWGSRQRYVAVRLLDGREWNEFPGARCAT